MAELPTTPIALAGVAIALVFTALAKNKNMPRWWPVAAYLLAFIALVGALGLAYVDIKPSASPMIHVIPAPVTSLPAQEKKQTATVNELGDHADAKINQKMKDAATGQQQVDVGKVGAGSKLDIQQNQ